MSTDGLDFDALALVAVKHPVTLGGQTWQLRDDYPASVGLDLFLLFTMPLAMRFQQAAAALQQDGATPTVEQVEATTRKVAADYEAAMLDACTALFQFSYPDMVRDKVATIFNPAQREAICAYFFTLRTPASPPPSSAGMTPPTDGAANPPSSPSAPTSETTTTTE